MSDDDKSDKAAKRGQSSNSACARKKTVDFARSLLPDEIPVYDNVSDRVDFITDLMANLNWVAGKTGEILAKHWNLSVSALKQYAAEASRRVTGPEDWRRTLTSGTEMLFIQAVKDGDRKGAAAIGTLMANVTGANKPTEQRITVEATPGRAADIMKSVFAGGVGANARDTEDDSKPDSDDSSAMTDES